MLSFQCHWVRLAFSLALLLAGLMPVERLAAQFRDPLTGKSGAAADSKPSRRPLLEVSLTESNDVFALAIHLKLPADGYTYSTNPDFSGGTRIKLTQVDGLEPIDEQFVSDHEPKLEFQPDFNQNVEKFKEAVTWTRRFRLRASTSKSDARILAQVKYQICDSQSCTPYDETFLVGLESPAEVIVTQKAKVEEFKKRMSSATKSETPAPQNSNSNTPQSTPTTATAVVHPLEIEVVPQRGKVVDPIRLQFRLAPDNAKPGESVLLSVTMKLDPEWHTFALDQNPDNLGLPTTFDILNLNGLKAAEEKFSPSLAAETKVATGGKEQRLHHKEITWTLPLVVEQSPFGLRGSITYQICRDGQCRPPKSVEFELGHIAEKATPPGPDNPGGTSKPPVDDDDSPIINGEQIVPREDQPAGLATFLVYAFLGGLILNVMPCVLPVIAIKVLGFVQQAGESRRRILTLNVMYSLGVVLVFLLLASLAVFAKMGWGNLFQKTEFQVAMSCLVFAMGLSLMGVFEIPVPGMVGSAASHQHQEGPLGAFLTGIFATLLATPCSGPFLGVTLGWSVQQEAHITYLVWLVMGLGMAFPYVLLGFFPAWVKYLPKPGNWMVTFKEVCGFVLMGTVIFLMSSLKVNWVLPLLILLLAIGLSLWMIGKLYTVTSTDRRRWTVRSFATLITVGGWWLAVTLADDRPHAHELPWKPFAGKAIKEELKQGRTVLVDFTADWCATCKTVEKLALNTKETLEHVKRHNIVTMKADWTGRSENIGEWLEALDSVSIPLTAIFPANDPTHPIVIRDLFTKTELLKKLDEAIATPAPSPAKNSQQSLTANK